MDTPFGYGYKVEFTLIYLAGKRSIVTNLYSLKRRNAIFFGYLHAVGTGGYAWLSKTFNMIGILQYLL